MGRSMMEPPQVLRSVLWFVVVFAFCAWLVRWVYEMVRPVLPFLFVVLVLMLLIRVWLLWRRWRFERW